MTSIDHPIFLESIRYIQGKLVQTDFEDIEQQVLLRLIHSSGDFEIEPLLKFSPDACQVGIDALKEGAPILTDTSMAASAIAHMAFKTLKTSVYCALEWAPTIEDDSLSRTAIGMEKACKSLAENSCYKVPPIVVIGSAPKALITLLDLIKTKTFIPSLIVGMPVGFISVLESKKLLASVDVPQIRLEGNRGGAALAAATVNALLRAAVKS